MTCPYLLLSTLLQVPLIELLNYFSKPLKLRTLQPAATSSTSAANGTADRPHNTWWKLYHYFFAHMSKSAALGFAVWAVWNVASFALVCSNYYRDKEHFDWSVRIQTHQYLCALAAAARNTAHTVM
jgi:hypothetical protein